MAVRVCCLRCKGTGTVELTGVYAETVAMLRRHRSPMNGAKLASLAGIKATAMCNRLKILERLGLAAAVRNGRELLWRAV